MYNNTQNNFNKPYDNYNYQNYPGKLKPMHQNMPISNINPYPSLNPQ